MEKVLIKSRPSRIKEKKPVNASLETFDLPAIIEKMKGSQRWASGELMATILLKSPNKQTVLTAMHKDTEIKSFQSNDSISILIIEGQLKFHTRKVELILGKGQLLTLHENIKYSLTTDDEETVFLLTILTSQLQASVN